MNVVVRRASWWTRLWAANPYVVDGSIALLLFLGGFGSMAGPEEHQRDRDVLRPSRRRRR